MIAERLTAQLWPGRPHRIPSGSPSGCSRLRRRTCGGAACRPRAHRRTGRSPTSSARSATARSSSAGSTAAPCISSGRGLPVAAGADDAALFAGSAAADPGRSRSAAAERACRSSCAPLRRRARSAGRRCVSGSTRRASARRGRRSSHPDAREPAGPRRTRPFDARDHRHVLVRDWSTAGTGRPRCGARRAAAATWKGRLADGTISPAGPACAARRARA